MVCSSERRRQASDELVNADCIISALFPHLGAWTNQQPVSAQTQWAHSHLNCRAHRPPPEPELRLPSAPKVRHFLQASFPHSCSYPSPLSNTQFSNNNPPLIQSQQPDQLLLL